jgi:hypothetical protein
MEGSGPVRPVAAADRVRVEQLMRDIEAEVRADRRSQIVARGGPSEYRDAEVFAAVERVLRRALDGSGREGLLIPELAADETEWRLQTHLELTSHRRVLGPAIVFLKRRILLPVARWLYEYTRENFRRQERVNRVLFACVEELAIENAVLQRRIAELLDGSVAERKS